MDAPDRAGAASAVPAGRLMRPSGLMRCRSLLRTTWAEGVTLTGLVVLAAAVFMSTLSTRAGYDEGVYLASLEALHRGQQLATQVFASQPPGFYLLLQLLGAIAGRSEHSLRLAMLALALLGLLAAYWIGRRSSGRLAALLAATLYIALPPVAAEAVRVRADLPATVLALLAVALALEARQAQRPRSGLLLAGSSGAVFAFAVSVKLDAVLAAIPLLLLLTPRVKRTGFLLWSCLAGAAGVFAGFLVAYAGSLGAIWSQSIGFHTQIEGSLIHGAPTSVGGNVSLLLDVLTSSRRLHDPAAWLLIAGVVATALAWRRLGRAGLALWALAIAGTFFLCLHRPLWPHDVVLASACLAISLAVGLAGVGAGRQRLLGGALIALVLLATARLAERELRAPTRPEPAAIRLAAGIVRARTPRDAYVVSDLPIVAVLADRPTPGPLVDTSYARLQSGLLSTATILRLLDRWHVHAVVVGRAFRSVPGLVAGVRARFPLRLRSGGLRIYLKP
jgi:hypothetical protein